MKFPFWATILTLAGFILLCLLGTWQLQRLQWKNALIAEINSEYAKDPMEFELTGDNLRALPQDKTMVGGFVEGGFIHEKSIAVGPRTHDGKPGFHIITPFETLDNYTLLVNRGWIPWEMKDGGYSEPDDPGIITGIARRPEAPSFLLPPNEPEKDQWLTIIPEEIAVAQNLSGILPFVLYINDEPNDAPYPVPVSLNQLPPNNHLGYALFWYCMAITLLGIYFLRFWGKR